MFSAQDLATALDLHQPTPEQVAVIEAPWSGVYRVIAGAGSGKTETMAMRVVWLVANGHVAAHEVLGLTFTRKAAGELGHRISSRLNAVHQAGLGPKSDEFERPTVSTYNSFAARLYREHASLVGLDQDASVLSEASAWGLARKVVTSSTYGELATWDLSVNEITRMVRVLAARMSENSLEPEQLEAFIHEFSCLRDLPPGGSGAYKDVDSWVSTIENLGTLVRLVDDYTEAKKARGVIEFSDQVALARQIVATHPGVIDDLVRTHAVVLLDEYQDTSVAQTSLLSTLFYDRPVMAVGDPFQAIYGWRGASSSNLLDFEHAFSSSGVTTFELQTSWRNGRDVLRLANQIASPLHALPGPTVGVLTPSDRASSHPVEVAFEESVAEEADRVADWLASHLTSPRGGTQSAAVLLRQRHHQRVFVERLRDRGLRVHVLGIGGLLDDPGVVDVVCTLRVLATGQAETELVRLLTGGRWRLGVSDVQALSTTARWLQGRDQSGQALSEEQAASLKKILVPSDNAGLLDALTFIVQAPESHHQRALYSPEGLARLRDVYQTLGRISQSGITAVDELIPVIERELGLDVEILAHPQRATLLAAREALMEAVHNYLAVSDDSSARGFVSWLEEAETRDNLTPRVEPPEPGCVQVLTIHGAKGLEWDVVALPRLVDDELPGSPRDSKGWLSRGELPYAFRGDRRTLPEFEWRQATTRKEAIESFEQFTDDVKAHRLAEERRLMYVAITRAKHHVLLSGSFWAHQQKPRTPSLFLREAQDARLIDSLPVGPVHNVPPEHDEGEQQLWPRDPLGSRRAVVSKAAELVTASLAQTQPPHDESVALLGALLERGGMYEQKNVLPVRLPASSLERLASTPHEYQSALARPLPRAPHQAALLGTLFHSYVEQRLGTTVPGPMVEMPDDGEEFATALSFEQWKQKFEASEFAHLEPVAIETELHVPLAGHLVICKLDAVFSTEDGVLIVDWKTGKKPDTDDEVTAKSIQLAAYRLAWAEWTNTPLESVRASFWFVEDEELITPQSLLDRAGLEGIITEAKKSLG